MRSSAELRTLALLRTHSAAFPNVGLVRFRPMGSRACLPTKSGPCLHWLLPHRGGSREEFPPARPETGQWTRQGGAARSFHSNGGGDQQTSAPTFPLCWIPTRAGPIAFTPLQLPPSHPSSRSRGLFPGPPFPKSHFSSWKEISRRQAPEPQSTRVLREIQREWLP